MNSDKQDLLLADLVRRGALGGFREMIEPLENYDREHNSDLVKTLRVFFEANANASEAAGKLFLHRNSLAYRLERIQEIIALDLKSSRTRLALQLGLLATENVGKEGSDEPKRP